MAQVPLPAPPGLVTFLTLHSRKVFRAGALGFFLLATISLVCYWPILVNEDFQAYLHCDGPQHGKQEAMSKVRAVRREKVKHRGRRLLAERTQTKWFIRLIFESRDGTNIFTEARLQQIRDLENRIQALPGYVRLCLASGSGECLRPLSVINYFYASFDAGEGIITPDGRGDQLLPIQAILAQIGTSSTYFVDRYFGVSSNQLQSALTGNITRSVFRFGTPLRGFRDRDDRENLQEEQFESFVKEELFPFLEAASTKDIRVYYYGNFITQHEYVMAVWHDACFALGSLVFILGYLIWYLKSFSLAFSALACIAVSFPLTYACYCLVYGHGKMIAINFLSLFVVLGVGADDVFVLHDVWVHSREHGTGEMALARRMWSMYCKAGLAIFATSATTAASFFANIVSSIGPLREFGFFMGTCITVNWVVVATLYPLILVNHERTRFKGAGFVSRESHGVQMQEQLVVSVHPDEEACTHVTCEGDGHASQPKVSGLLGQAAACAIVLAGIVFTGLMLFGGIRNLKPASGLPQFMPPDSNLGALQQLQMRFGNETSVGQENMKYCHGSVMSHDQSCDSAVAAPQKDPQAINLPLGATPESEAMATFSSTIPNLAASMTRGAWTTLPPAAIFKTHTASLRPTTSFGTRALTSARAQPTQTSTVRRDRASLTVPVPTTTSQTKHLMFTHRIASHATSRAAATTKTLYSMAVPTTIVQYTRPTADRHRHEVVTRSSSGAAMHHHATILRTTVVQTSHPALSTPPMATATRRHVIHTSTTHSHSKPNPTISVGTTQLPLQAASQTISSARPVITQLGVPTALARTSPAPSYLPTSKPAVGTTFHIPTTPVWSIARASASTLPSAVATTIISKELTPTMPTTTRLSTASVTTITSLQPSIPIQLQSTAHPAKTNEPGVQQALKPVLHSLTTAIPTTQPTMQKPTETDSKQDFQDFEALLTTAQPQLSTMRQQRSEPATHTASTNSADDFKVRLRVQGHSAAEIQALEATFKARISERLGIVPGDLTFDVVHERRLQRSLQESDEFEVTLHFHNLSPEKEEEIRLYLAENKELLQLMGATPEEYPTKAPSTPRATVPPTIPPLATPHPKPKPQPLPRPQPPAPPPFKFPKWSPFTPSPPPLRPHSHPHPSPPPPPAPQGTPPPVVKAPILHLKKRGMARDRQGLVHVVWGLRETGRGDGSYEADQAFDLTAREAQLAVVEFCQRLHSMKELKISTMSCWPMLLRNYLSSRGQAFPSYVLNTVMTGFMEQAPMWVNDHLDFAEDGSLMWLMVDFRVEFDTHSSGLTIQPFMNAWEEAVTKVNQDVFRSYAGSESSLGPAVTASEMFQRAEAEGRVLGSALSSWLVSVGCALAALLVFTRSFSLSAIACFAMFATAACSLFFITAVFKWSFGLMEAVSLIIFCGFSVDYPLHVVQAYVMERSKGAGIRLALKEVGWAVASGCFTTCGAAAFLNLCTITIFQRFGQVLIVNMVFALIFALVWIPASLEACSRRKKVAQGETGELRQEPDADAGLALHLLDGGAPSAGISTLHQDRLTMLSETAGLEVEPPEEGFAALDGGTPRGKRWK